MFYRSTYSTNFSDHSTLRADRARGFSLIEMIVVIAITTMVVGALGSAIVFFYRSNSYAVEQAGAINSARKGVEFMSRDIREAAYGADGSFPVALIGPYEFIFYSDTDDDTRAERVRYRVNATVLEKGVIPPTGDPAEYLSANETFSRVAEDVRNIARAIPVFVYFDDAGVQITVLSRVTDVAYARTNVIVDANPNRDPAEFSLRSSATLRNLKTNL